MKPAPTGDDTSVVGPTFALKMFEAPLVEPALSRYELAPAAAFHWTLAMPAVTEPLTPAGGAGSVHSPPIVKLTSLEGPLAPQWARTFDVAPDQLRGIETVIAGELLAAMGLDAPRPGGHAARPTPSAAAYEAYLKGRYFWNLRTRTSVPKAIEYFNEAIRLHPQYAAAYAGLADAHAFQSVVLDVITPHQARERAYAAAETAVSLGPLLAEAHLSLAMLRCRFDWDWSLCEAGLRRAIELDPGFTTAHHWLGVYLTQMGRLDEARASLEHALSLDPLSTIVTTALGVALMYSGSHDAAVEQLESAIELSPSFVLAHRVLGNTYAHAGDFARALAALEHAVSLAPADPHAIADLGHAYGRAGRMADAHRSLQRLQALAIERHATPYDFAVIYAGLRDHPRALKWLDEAYEQRATGLPYLKVDPIFRDLQGEPRFVALRRKVGLPE